MAGNGFMVILPNASPLKPLLVLVPWRPSSQTTALMLNEGVTFLTSSQLAYSPVSSLAKSRCPVSQNQELPTGHIPSKMLLTLVLLKGYGHMLLRTWLNLKKMTAMSEGNSPVELSCLYNSFWQLHRATDIMNQNGCDDPLETLLRWPGLLIFPVRRGAEGPESFRRVSDGPSSSRDSNPSM